MQKLSPEISTEIVETLGGTKRVAEEFKLSLPAISFWKSRGIPFPYVKYLAVKYGELSVLQRKEVKDFLKTK